MYVMNLFKKFKKFKKKDNCSIFIQPHHFTLHSPLTCILILCYTPCQPLSNPFSYLSLPSSSSSPFLHPISNLTNSPTPYLIEPLCSHIILRLIFYLNFPSFPLPVPLTPLSPAILSASIPPLPSPPHPLFPHVHIMIIAPAFCNNKRWQ